jgi:hypothetical protein
MRSNENLAFFWQDGAMRKRQDSAKAYTNHPQGWKIAEL